MERDHSFEFVNATHLAGVLEVQDASAAPIAEAAQLCRAAVDAAWPKINAYANAGMPWTVTVRLGDEEEGRTLNRDFRHKDYATNVLSFPNDEADPAATEWYVGDIFICVPVVVREATEMGRSVAHHLQHLVVHGLLHLVGYDHELGEHEAAVMEDMESDILTGMGLPDPYSVEEDKTA